MSRKNIRLHLTHAALGTLACSSLAAANDGAKPNIIFIIADDMGYGDPSCYGNRVIKTPNIDQLASEGVRFTQAYAGSAVSSPSRCALLTGKHSGHGRIRDNFCKAGGMEGLKNKQIIRRNNLLATDTTLALILKNAGYRTALINKWHQDGFNPEATPLNRGFDEFKGWLVSSPESNLPYYYPSKRFDNTNLVEIKANQNGVQGRHCNDISTDESIEFITRNQNKPFFLYLAYDSPHEPYIIKERGEYENMPLSESAKTYAALVTSLDKNVGRVLNCLRKLKLDKNSIVIFVSDNGGAVMAPHSELNCNGGLRGLKGNFYEGGIRVPMIAKWPTHFKAGMTSNQLTYFPDIMPTIASFTGAQTPSGMDGISLKPHLTGQKSSDNNRYLYWEFPYSTQAARHGDWKIIRPAKSTTYELYNLKEDPYETKDVSAQHPEIVADFMKYLSAARTDSENWPAPVKGK